MKNEEIKNILLQIRNWLIAATILLLINIIVLIVVNGDGIRNYDASSSGGSGSGSGTNNEETNADYDVGNFESVTAEQLFNK